VCVCVFQVQFCIINIVRANLSKNQKQIKLL
jgi:hypothetical protein